MTPAHRTSAGTVPPSDAAALVIGLDSHGLAVARALADGGVTVYALEKDPTLPGVATNRVRRVFAADDFREDTLVRRLLQVREELAAYPRVVLLANNDRHVAAIARHLDQLRPHYRIAWADRADTVLRLQRKSELEAHSLRQGLRYPRSVTFTEPDQAGQAQGFTYPMIIKPVQPLSSFKTLLARDLDELARHLQAHAHDLPILGQEYVAGDDRCIYFGALVMDQGRTVYGLAGRKLLSHPPARGQTTAAETVDEPEVLRLTEQFFAGTGLTGPVSLELKRDPQGRYWVIEPTVGRTDFWAELCISAGFNQPLMEFRLALGLPVQGPDGYLPCVWYDTERDPMAYVSLCRHEHTLRPRTKRQTYPYLGHRDAAPLVRALLALAKDRWRRRRSANRSSTSSSSNNPAARGY